ncbi:uncharacterized protein I206_105308 [Kwoniella pini CBS 10737]|uniref:ferric-chelate reductase (NADPH) n=1 Tax=Kwoniella pini CBS 10737 TaxID=1296096 RepID=A0A1B9I4M3_9TREE|nr:uncharacterized protein I206_03782 [Kwoniella pini CBS 10737]OCF50460.1 hypothetical protein I206_03782 [Kwoniella pini CBS 10737]
MPLIGDPLLASLLYGASVTFDLKAATQTVAAIASVATATTVNTTQIVQEQKDDQMGMDSTMPRNLYLAFSGLLLLCMIISHPRFLARLFASLPTSSSQPKKKDQVIIYPYSKQSIESLRPKREVSGGDLSQGWFLRKGRNSRIEISSPISTPDTSSKKDPFNSAFAYDEKSLSSATLDSSSYSNPKYYPPPHIIPLLNHLPFSSTFQFVTPFSILPSHLKSHLTLPQLYLIVGYLILIAFALVWKSDLSPASKDKGYGSDWMRSGLVATAQIPLTIALGVRGNIIGLCVGKGYERLKVYHKIVGRVVFLASTIHGAAYMYKWTVAGKFSAYAAKPFAMWGLLAYFALVLIVVTSLPWVRKAWHGVFEVCHFVGIVGLLVGLALHVAVAIPFCVAAMIIYLISIFFSLTKTRIAHAELQALPGAGTTVITIPGLKTGWRAGQHVRIRVPALGLLKAFESHPFTIASAPDGEGLVLMCKRAGDWTNQLYELAQRSSDFEDRAEGGRNQATIIIEGPYGGLGNTLITSFSSVVLIAGGSGITQSLSLAEDLISKSPTGVVRANTIDLIWMVKNEDNVKPFLTNLLKLINQAKQLEIECLESLKKGENLIKFNNSISLRIKIFITRCPASSPLNLLSNYFDEEFKIEEEEEIFIKHKSIDELKKNNYLSKSDSTKNLKQKNFLPLSSISIKPIKPNFDILINSIIDENSIGLRKRKINSSSSSGILITCCGPFNLIENVRNTIKNVNHQKKLDCGGIEFEDEHFGF